jgi:hypothetical protein
LHGEIYRRNNMDYYKVDPNNSSTEEFANLVAFYQSGGKHEEPLTEAPETPEAPASRKSSDPVRKRSSESPRPASAPTKTSAPEKPAGIFASIKRGFKKGVEKTKARSGSDSDSDEKKKTSKVKSALETAEKEVSGIIQRADEVVLSGVKAIDRFLRRNG